MEEKPKEEMMMMEEEMMMEEKMMEEEKPMEEMMMDEKPMEEEPPMMEDGGEAAMDWAKITHWPSHNIDMEFRNPHGTIRCP